ncbi:MAG: division/cell wall cluster transcriptional repressor MraZ [Solirubrobacterales bacterium]|jgi:MraZ protein|uniref:Transcriptional regulator MraZ n=1 Tax=freshwater metagenome TaxID=449393 RepID=A0A6J7CZZ1_9ZZZZ|nr:division/cell wall cluster transcriptional repressor MraZ [Solirubrobacterales bacterium]MSW87471.1 division/cell wall cluster transcriptional repressor MraZ [Actinomycetota bacterium]
MSFLGTYDHTLDAKNRLTVPVKFRGPLGEGAIISRGIETCVSVWTPKGYDEWSKSMLDALGGMTPEARRFRRVLSASAFETELDAAGRIMIPAKLMEHAVIEREVAVIGNDDAFEVWDRKAWAAYDAEVSPTILDLTDAIGADA